MPDIYMYVYCCVVGDISPREGIPKAEKRRLEAVSVLWIVSL
jgi:hypothetical protein